MNPQSRQSRRLTGSRRVFAAGDQPVRADSSVRTTDSRSRARSRIGGGVIASTKGADSDLSAREVVEGTVAVGLSDWGRRPAEDTMSFVLAEGENETTRAVACVDPGWTSVGGDLVVTSHRIVFTPVDVRKAASVLVWVSDKVGGPAALGKAVDRGVDMVGAPRDLVAEQGNPTAVRAGRSASLFRAPTLILVSDGRENEIGILSGRFAPNIDRRNTVERDRMLAVITEWIGCR